MGLPVVHFEIAGSDAERLRDFYGSLFKWEFDTDSPVPPEISRPGNYGFVTRYATDDGAGIPGGIGGGPGYHGHVLFYVGVPDVATALQEAGALGGKRVLGPLRNPSGQVVIGHFLDPEGHLMGVAGPK